MFAFEQTVRYSDLVPNNVNFFVDIFRRINFSSVVAVLSLLIAVLSLLNERRNMKIAQQVYEDSRSERQERRLQVNFIETFKDDSEEYDNHLWGAKFLINNKSSEHAYFYSLTIELELNRYPPSYRFLHLLTRLLSEEEKYVLEFQYQGGRISASEYLFEPYPNLPMLSAPQTYLVNWETKESVVSASRSDRSQFRMTPPGEKEVWMLFGYLPMSWIKEWKKHNFYLLKLRCIFFTDHGEIILNGKYALGHSLSESFRAILDEIAELDRSDP